MAFATGARRAVRPVRRPSAVSRGCALDQQFVALRPDADVQEGFELPEVLVVGPEEGRHARLGHRDAAGRYRADLAISFCINGLTFPDGS